MFFRSRHTYFGSFGLDIVEALYSQMLENYFGRMKLGGPPSTELHALTLRTFLTRLETVEDKLVPYEPWGFTFIPTCP